MSAQVYCKPLMWAYYIIDAHGSRAYNIIADMMHISILPVACAAVSFAPISRIKSSSDSTVDHLPCDTAVRKS